MRQKILLFISMSAVIFVFFCCDSESTAPDKYREISLEIDTVYLQPDSIWTVGGPGYYSKVITIRDHQFDPLCGDSVVQMLLDSNIYIEEFWYPAEVSIAHNPYIGLFEIARLNQPDTAICSFGYSPMDSIKSTQSVLVRRWRHYNVIR
ncbi:MAG: hypothetical protein JXA06_07680 [Bacteroidetes bacterium]|nr:hypothetical protein [Bacteroidota bacterium]